MCHTPGKVRFLTMREAACGALEALEQHNSPQRPYECACGGWHLTSRNENGQPFTADMVRALARALNLKEQR